MGRAEGEGRQKGRTSFLCVFFFFTSFTGRGVCRQGFPPGPLSGDHACSGAFSPSSVGPLPLLPPNWEAGQPGDGKKSDMPLLEKPGPLSLREMGTLGIPVVRGITGGRGLDQPHISPSPRGRQAGRPGAPAPPALGQSPAQSPGCHTSPCPLGSELNGGACPRAPFPQPYTSQSPRGPAPPLQEPSCYPS